MKPRTFTALISLAVAAGTMVALAGDPSAAANKPSDAWKREPTNEDYALLVHVNAARAEPTAYPKANNVPGTEAPAPPMRWNDDLADAARYHAYDRYENRCSRPAHTSCNGQAMENRITGFYPGWFQIGETMAGNHGALAITEGWMRSHLNHRQIALNPNYHDFGAGAVVYPTDFGTYWEVVADYGYRGDVSTTGRPNLPAATVLPRQGAANVSRELYANAYHVNGVDSVVAVVNGQEIPMSKWRGIPVNGKITNATYKVTKSFTGTGCYPLYFQMRSGASTYRWPETGEVLVGVNRTDCAEHTTSAPVSTTTTTVPSNGVPQVVIDSPANNYVVNGHTTIKAHATHPQGIVRMELYVDGKRKVRVGTDTLNRNWLSGQKSVKPGTYKIEVKAWSDLKKPPGVATITVVKE